MATPNELLQFAETNKKKPGLPCPICILPERELIDDARRKAKPRSLGGKVVRAWLIQRKGYTDKTAPQVHQIERHFGSGHHRR